MLKIDQSLRNYDLLWENGNLFLFKRMLAALKKLPALRGSKKHKYNSSIGSLGFWKKEIIGSYTYEETWNYENRQLICFWSQETKFLRKLMSNSVFLAKNPSDYRPLFEPFSF